MGISIDLGIYTESETLTLAEIIEIHVTGECKVRWVKFFSKSRQIALDYAKKCSNIPNPEFQYQATHIIRIQIQDEYDLIADGLQLGTLDDKKIAYIDGRLYQEKNHSNFHYYLPFNFDQTSKL